MKGYPTHIMREGRSLSLITERSVLRRVKTLREGKSNGHKWECDVWKLGEENLNGRIYTEELAERLCEENIVTTINDGHFHDWYSGMEYGCTRAVASGLHIENHYLKCNIDFLASEKDFEDKLAELIEKGVAIGVSSCGYGEYEADGKTVKADTYEMLRIVDFVTEPAGMVYASLGGANEEDNDEDEVDKEGAAPDDKEEPNEDGNKDEAGDSDEDEDKEPIEDGKCAEKSESVKSAISEIIRRYRT